MIVVHSQSTSFEIYKLLVLSQAKNTNKRRAKTSDNLELSQTLSGNLKKKFVVKSQLVLLPSGISQIIILFILFSKLQNLLLPINYSDPRPKDQVVSFGNRQD